MSDGANQHDECCDECEVTFYMRYNRLLINAIN